MINSEYIEIKQGIRWSTGKGLERNANKKV